MIPKPRFLQLLERVSILVMIAASMSTPSEGFQQRSLFTGNRISPCAVSSASPHVWRRRRRRHPRHFLSNKDDEDSERMEAQKKDDNIGNNLASDPLDSFDEWLDKPFFDPLSYSEEDPSWKAKLARFVQSDYDRFELLYAGIFLSVMLVVSQELFRIQLYGTNYRPFSSMSEIDTWLE